MEGREKCASPHNRNQCVAHLNSSLDYTLASKLGCLVPFGTPWGVQSVHMGLTHEKQPRVPFWSGSWRPGLDPRHLKGHESCV